MKTMTVILLALLGLLQYKFWLGEGSIAQILQLKTEIGQYNKIITQWHERNSALVAEIKDLKLGTQAIEELGRSQLGMVKYGETFYQIVEKKA